MGRRQKYEQGSFKETADIRLRGKKIRAGTKGAKSGNIIQKAASVRNDFNGFPKIGGVGRSPERGRGEEDSSSRKAGGDDLRKWND